MEWVVGAVNHSPGKRKLSAPQKSLFVRLKRGRSQNARIQSRLPERRTDGNASVDLEDIVQYGAIAAVRPFIRATVFHARMNVVSV